MKLQLYKVYHILTHDIHEKTDLVTFTGFLKSNMIEFQVVMSSNGKD